MSTQPTKRDLIEYILSIYPQGNPFNDYSECLKSVNAKFGIHNEIYFKCLFYRLRSLFKGSKVRGIRQRFWRQLENTGNLEIPFQAGNYDRLQLF